MKRIGLILLAAGGSRRLGHPKQLLEYEGRTLLRRAAMAACGSRCDPIVIVLGAEYDRCMGELAGLPTRAVLNPQWSEGIAGSIRLGLTALLEDVPEIEAAVLCLCDQPHLSSAVLNTLVSAYLGTGKSIVASKYNDTLGAPALFDVSRFPDLLKLSGDEGARRLFTRMPEEVVAVPFSEGAHDVDTPEDYRRLGPASPCGINGL